MARTKAFTLIEVLILIAIGSLLVSIATEMGRSFHAGTRVAEERRNLRAIRTALENYFVDSAAYLPQPEYPFDAANEDMSWAALTTPVAYLNGIPRSNFGEFSLPSQPVVFRFYYWGGGVGSVAGQELRRKFYMVTSCGPDGRRNATSGDLWRIEAFPPQVILGESAAFRGKLYDPTNGAVSGGDFYASPAQVYN